ncbi:MAG: 2-oxo acid dehydrogenase subunit E2 [Verrucomicrobiales bacterium]|nr:2-oxo acid dehydrogenase subunit E2 [Verrucomicrobiales bacterium]
MDVKLPNLGEGADSGTVISVLVKPGAPVKKGQNIIELETGKAVAPIPSPADGTVGRIAVKEGDKLAVGQLILVLEGAAAASSRGPASAPAAVAAPAPAPASARKKAVEARPTPSKTVPADAQSFDVEFDAVVNENPVAGPYVRRVARDLGIDLHWVLGTGKSGQILASDLKDYVARLRSLAAGARVGASPRTEETTEPKAPVKATAPVIDFSQWGPVTRKVMTPLRKTIAQRMVESSTTLPTVTQFDQVDVTALEELRKKHGPGFQAKGTRLTLTSFVLKAVASTLRKHPIFNASIDDAADEIVFKDYVHLGLAVDTEAGLLVPVIRDADKKDLLQLSNDVQEVAAKARDRKLGLADMQGGTFTISNQGGIGGGHFTPIVNKPEVAILGLGRGAAAAVVRDGKIVARTLLPVALTYDHRIIDGGLAARFVVDLVAALEGFPESEVKL